jgi:hypothetical protein
MKTMIITAALVAAVSTQAAEPGDTIKVTHAHRVTIVNADSLLSVTVDGTDERPTYHYEASLQNTDGNYESASVAGRLVTFGLGNKITTTKRHDRYACHDSELHFFCGFNGNTGSDNNVNTNLWGGANFGLYIDWGVHPWHDGSRFSVGFGVEWKNWRMTNRNQFVKATDGNISVEPLPEGSDPKFSRIKTFSLIIPLMYRYEKKDWGFSIGPVIDCTTHSSIKTRYTLDGTRYKQKDKGLHHNKVTVDLMATFVNPLVDVYVKYNPCEVLDTQYGPKFHSLSLGVIL